MRLTEDGAIKLRDAIILKACKDYVTGRKREENGGKIYQGIDPAIIRDFFHSAWFEMLTDLDPDVILDHLEAQVSKKCKAS